MRIITVGHSTRTLDELTRLLEVAGARLLVDVRRFPASRRHPHFAREHLELLGRTSGAAPPTGGAGSGLPHKSPFPAYLWLEGLGGRRSRRKDTPHTAWRVPAFAGYADHMDTAEFRAAADVLLARAAADGPAAVMCAEAHPSQCHRRLLADWLVARGHEVVHVLGLDVEGALRAEAHALTPFARVEDGRVIYDKGQLSLDQIRRPSVRMRSRSRES